MSGNIGTIATGVAVFGGAGRLAHRLDASKDAHNAEARRIQTSELRKQHAYDRDNPGLFSGDRTEIEDSAASEQYDDLIARATRSGAGQGLIVAGAVVGGPLMSFAGHGLWRGAGAGLMAAGVVAAGLSLAD